MHEINDAYNIIIIFSFSIYLLCASRFVDPDGSETKGDLVGGGVVSYASRNSAMMTGILGKYSSEALKAIERRDANSEAEWKYNFKTVNVEEEEEDEEEDEEAD